MNDDRFNWMLKNKIVTDFRGFPIGRVRKLWVDSAKGPMVIVERNRAANINTTLEAIPLRAIDTVDEEVRLKPPTFAE
jgi:hypothetical protein